MRILTQSAAVAAAALSAASIFACAPCDNSVALFFPNDAAKNATKRIRVEVYSFDSGGVSGGAKDCAEFMGSARRGPRSGNATRSQDYPFPFEKGAELAKVPAGRQIIYILGYGRGEAPAPILEGCSDRFDSKGGKDRCSDVPVQMKVVLPDSARLVKVAGDRQVGREGETLAVPLRVRVEAEPATVGTTYYIPGVEVSFKSKDDDFALVGAKAGKLDLVTDAKGEAQAQLKLPNKSKSGEVVATAQQLQAITDKPDHVMQTFSVSVTAPAVVKSTSTINGSGIPIAAALGRVTGGAQLDLVVLSCEGSAAGCVPGSEARPPFGATKLTVISRIGTMPFPLTVQRPAEGLGLLPSGLAVADFLPPLGQDDIAIVNSRRSDCQNRICAPGQKCGCFGAAPGTRCPCEGSEVLVLKHDGSNVVIDHRRTMTASNAVGLAAFRFDGAAYMNVATAAQGRTTNLRPCSLSGSTCYLYDTAACIRSPSSCACIPGRDCEGAACRPGSPGCICVREQDVSATNPDPCTALRHPDRFGCPPLEKCECPGCPSNAQVGVCVARDKVVDLLSNRWGTTPTALPCSRTQPNGICPDPVNQVCQSGTCVGRSLFNRGGCQNPVVSCNKGAMMRDAMCACLDDYNLNLCQGSPGMDGCGCRVPDRISIGETDAQTPPANIVSGPLRMPGFWDIVVPSVGGLELVAAQTVQKTFSYKSTPIVNALVHRAVIAKIDSDDAPDIAFISRAACTAGSNFQDSCPVFREASGVDAKGCVGAYFTDRALSVFDVRIPQSGGCRRYMLPFAPDSLCAGLFNDDQATDIAIASKDSHVLSLAAGDGKGGLLDPPQEIMLPQNGVGGPIACGDVDGNGTDDVVVINALTGDIYVILLGN